jgi:hypothetical protein
MEDYKSIHIISEAVIVGGLSIYVYKKISELESTVEELKQQIAMQNNQLRYLLGLDANSQRTPLRIPNHPPQFDTEGVISSCSSDALQKESQGAPSEWFTSNKPNMECNGGVCTLSSAAKGRRDPQDVPYANQRVEPGRSIIAPFWDRAARDPKSVGHLARLDGRNDVMMATRHYDRQEDKKVVISKISKQIEFDRENNDLDQSLKVNTFTKFSPNPVIKSVTPKPSTSSITIDNDEETNELDNILNEIDNE